MEICATCAAELDPSWKFCVRCGTSVPAGAAHQTRNEQNAAEAAAPAAIPAAAPAKAARKPRRAKSKFEPKTTATPIVTIPSEPFADIPEPEPAASLEQVLTPESALTEPALPDSLLHGEKPSVPSQSRPANSDVSRLGQARAEYARAEREAAELALAEQEATERAREAHEASERARAEREAAERALAEREATERALAELEAAEQARADSAAALSEPAQAEPAQAEPAAVLAPAETLAVPPVVTNENPFIHNLPPRPLQPQSRAEAKAAAAERAVARARNTAAAKAEIRAKYPIPSASSNPAEQSYSDEIPAAFRTVDGSPVKRRVDVPLVVSISLATAGVILIVYLAILVFGAHG